MKIKADFLSWQKSLAYSLLGSKFSTNLLFVASKCHVTIQRRGSSRWSKWPNDQIVAVVKHYWPLVQRRRNCRERWLKTTTGYVFKKILVCLVSRRVIVINWFSWLCLKDQLGLCSLNCHTHAMTGNWSAS